MRILRLQNLLTVGLLAKVVGLILALILAWPLITSSPSSVQAEDKKATQEKEAAKPEGKDKKNRQGKKRR